MPYLIEHCQFLMAEHGSLLATLFLAGLVGGVSHCAGMCGPFVVAQIASPEAKNLSQSFLRRLTGKALLPYHFGRMTSYIMLGMIAALLSKQIMGTPLARVTSAVFLVLAGVIFIASAFPKSKRLLAFLRLKQLEKIGSWLGKIAHRLFYTQDVSGRYGLGVMLGFLPCGLVFAALMAVSTTGNPFTAAAAMMVFTIGTMPTLLAIGFGSQGIQHYWPVFFKKAAKLVMILNGCNLFFLAAKAVL